MPSGDYELQNLLNSYSEYFKSIRKRISKLTKEEENNKSLAKEINNLKLFDENNIPTLDIINARTVKVKKLLAILENTSMRSKDLYLNKLKQLSENAEVYKSYYKKNYTGKIYKKIVDEECETTIIGYLDNGLMNGEGIYKQEYFTDEDGSLSYVYEGNFINDYSNGQGKRTYKNGKTLIGNFEDEDLTSGKIVFPNGNVYIGEIFDDNPNGKGTMTLKNGTKINGQFAGHNEGYIKEKEYYRVDYINGEQYYGQLSSKYTRNGLGKLNRLDGKKLKGQFIDGSFVSLKADKKKEIYSNSSIDLFPRLIILIVFLALQIGSTILLKYFAFGWYSLISQPIIIFLYLFIYKLQTKGKSNIKFDVIERILLVVSTLVTSIIVSIPVAAIIIGAIISTILLSCGNYFEDETSNVMVEIKVFIALIISGIMIFFARELINPLINNSIWHILWIIVIECLVSAIPVMFDCEVPACTITSLLNLINLIVLNIICIVSLGFNFGIMMFIILMVVVWAISGLLFLGLANSIRENK